WSRFATAGSPTCRAASRAAKPSASRVGAGRSSGLPAEPLQPVEDQVEAELELASAVAGRRRQMLLGVLGEVRVARTHLRDESSRPFAHVLLARHRAARGLGVAQLPEREAED